MNSTEAAAYLNVNVATLWQHRRRGTGPRAVLVGRTLEYSVADLDAWVESRNVPGRRGRPLNAGRAAT